MTIPRSIINISVVLITVLLCLSVMEFFLRRVVITYKVSPGPNSTYVIELDEYKMTVSTNSLNLRGDEIRAKKDGEIRILCIGDSFTFGLGVNNEETYEKVCENILNKDSKRFFVINGGGFSWALREYSFLVDRGLTFHPDLVIAQIFIGNDFYDAMSSIDQSEVRPGKKMEDLSAKLRDGFRNCYTLQLIWNKLINIRYVDDMLFRFNLRYGNRGVYLRNYPKLEKKLIKNELEALGKIDNLCKNNGIKTLFVIVPDKTQFLKKQFLNNDKYDYKKPNEILKDFFLRNNIAYIDFLEKYETLPKERVKSFYYVRDIHWTVRGHKYAAEIIAPYVRGLLNIKSD